MAAVAAFQALAPLPARHGQGDVVDACRRLTGDDRATRNDPALVESLRLLEGCLNAWRQSCLEHAAHHVGAAPPPIALGAFARSFAAWLAAHPERSGEPVEWLVREVLSTLETRHRLAG